MTEYVEDILTPARRDLVRAAINALGRYGIFEGDCLRFVYPTPSAPTVSAAAVAPTNCCITTATVFKRVSLVGPHGPEDFMRIQFADDEFFFGVETRTCVVARARERAARKGTTK